MFTVTNPDGSVYGPVDLGTLRLWASRGQIAPNSVLRDVATGQQWWAGQHPYLAGCWPGTAPPRRPFAIPHLPPTAAVVVLIVSGLLLLVTGPKLHKMAVITGDAPGGKVEMATVTRKWAEEPGFGSRARETRCMVEWALGGTGDTGTSRVTPDAWQGLREGSRIEVVSVPGDSSRYTRHDVYVEPGNFVFDRVLLAGEIAGIVAGVLSLIVAVVQDRRSAAWRPAGEP